MANRQTKVTLSAQIQSYVDGMEKAARATRETGSEAEKLAQKGKAIEQLGRAAMVGGGAVLAGLGLATKAAMEWESAWAGVTKTVDGTPEQMRVLEQGLRDLAKELPATHTEIAAVAEAAGQLGIQTPNVIAFTRTMIDLGETTNLTADQAATQLARFVNVMGTSQSAVSNLGSALVDLGNNYATTEAEILEMSLRLAGAGKQIGMSEGEVMGLATALSSVGIEAEAGGSAMSKVMIDIAASVDAGGERLELFAQTAGVSASEFAAKWRSEPGAALALFVQGLANAEAQGSSTLGVLAELGVTEVRMRDALLRSASASDIFTQAMNQGNAAFEENNALTDEAEKRYETTAAKMQILANQISDAAISLGDHLLPALNFAIDGMGSFADGLAGLEGPMGAFVAWGGLILGTGLLGVGVWMTAVPKIAEYKMALETLEISAGRLHSTLKVVGTVVGGIAIWATLANLARYAEADVSKLSNAMERNVDVQEMLARATEAHANRGWGSLIAGLNTAEMSAENVGEALDFAAGKVHSLNRGELTDILSSLELVGDEIARVAQTDFGAAQAQMRGLGEELQWTDDQMWQFIENSDTLRDALEMQAGSLGLTTEKTDLLKIAWGKVGPAFDTATEASEDNAKSLEALQGVAKDTTDAVEDLADEIRNFGSAQFDVEKATISFHDALDDLTENLNSGSASLDVTTEAGRETRGALLDAASATNDLAAATLSQTGSQEEANAVLEQGRERLIETMVQLGWNEDAARAYADQLIATPEAVNTAVQLSGVDQAERDLAWVARRREALIDIKTNGGAGSGALNFNPFGSANGNLFEFANGGGLETGIYSGGPPLTRFAEPETGWEAFISGKPWQEARNRQIWVDAGERLGMGDVMKAAAAAVSGAAPSLDGMSISGRLEIGGDGIARLVDGRIDRAFSGVSRQRVQSQFGT